MLLQDVTVAATPLNVTVLVPCVFPNPAPVTETAIVGPPLVLDSLVMPGPGVTVNSTPLLATPPTVTTTLPVVAVEGTVAVIEVALQLVIEAKTPLKVTLLPLEEAPKLLPEIVTGIPAGPDVGERLVIEAGLPTVKVTQLLLKPPIVTVTQPVVAFVGTGTTIEVSLQLVGVAAVPLNDTVLEPWVAPKLLPLIVTGVPAVPRVGERLVIVPLVFRVKLTLLLATPPTVTITGPVVVPTGTGTVIAVRVQFVGVAVTPLKVTVLLPCVAPKPYPLIVTVWPICALEGETFWIVGVVTTVKLTLLLATELVITTGPVVAPVGTGA